MEATTAEQSDGTSEEAKTQEPVEVESAAKTKRQRGVLTGWVTVKKRRHDPRRQTPGPVQYELLRLCGKRAILVDGNDAYDEFEVLWKGTDKNTWEKEETIDKTALKSFEDGTWDNGPYFARIPPARHPTNSHFKENLELRKWLTTIEPQTVRPVEGGEDAGNVINSNVTTSESTAVASAATVEESQLESGARPRRNKAFWQEKADNFVKILDKGIKLCKKYKQAGAQHSDFKKELFSRIEKVFDEVRGHNAVVKDRIPTWEQLGGYALHDLKDDESVLHLNVSSGKSYHCNICNKAYSGEQYKLVVKHILSKSHQTSCDSRLTQLKSKVNVSSLASQAGRVKSLSDHIKRLFITELVKSGK